MEYKAVNLSCLSKTGEDCEKMVENTCSELAKDGWELVTFQSYDKSNKLMFVFKR